MGMLFWFVGGTSDARLRDYRRTEDRFNWSISAYSAANETYNSLASSWFPHNNETNQSAQTETQI